MLYTLYFAVGLIVGSALNLLIAFLPRKNNMLEQIQSARYLLWHRPFVLLPVIGGFISANNYSDSGLSLSLRRTLVELLTGVFFILCLSRIFSSADLFKTLVFTCFLIVISFIDYDYSLIFDNVLIPMALIGVAFNLFIGDIKILNMFFSGLLGGSIFLALAVVSRGGFGGGDIKLMSVIGLWLGIKYTILAVFLSFIFGGLGAAILVILKKKTIKDKFPYGPYIALASFIALLYGDYIALCYYNWAFQVK